MIPKKRALGLDPRVDTGFRKKIVLHQRQRNDRRCAMPAMDQPPAYYQIAQAESAAPEAEQIDVSKLFPPTAISGDIRVTVIPPSGAVLIYSQGKADEAVRFNGPTSDGTVPLSGGALYVQKIEGATDWTLEVLKWQTGDAPKQDAPKQ
jgi:hypothetical protein